MLYQKPRLMIAALKGGSGKTLVSLGLLAAWRRFEQRSLVAFKKGPDYIDAGWLALAAGPGHRCYNLDPFLMEPDAILRSFVTRSAAYDGALIEGNRGLYDGVDAEGTCSSAELAKLLQTPVVLVVDVTKVTRTSAALVLGCRELDPDVRLAGVILNQVAGKRHETVVRESIERYCQVPVVGVVPKAAGGFFPERHMGLVPTQEHPKIMEAVAFAAEVMRDCVDLERLWAIAKTAPPLGWPLMVERTVAAGGYPPVTIGVIRDSAFQFYYPENLEALEAAGGRLRMLSSLALNRLPEVDALYIGGGFPETHLELLANNQGFRDSVRKAVEGDLPVYAECGGLMYLSRGIHHDGHLYPMVGVFPCEVALGRKPQGHGYTVAECVAGNPFIPEGAIYRGHEFHYSRVINLDNEVDFALRLRKGHGIVKGRDGMCRHQALAVYTHLHAVGNDFWAEGVIRQARLRRLASSACAVGVAERKGELRLKCCVS